MPHISSAAFFGGDACRCSCAEEIISKHGGEQHLLHFVAVVSAAQERTAAEAAAAAAAAAGGRSAADEAAAAALNKLQASGYAQGYFCVRTQLGDLATYGLVHEQGVCSTRDRQRHGCEHVACLRAAGMAIGRNADPATGAPGRMLQARLDKLVEQRINLATGEWRLTCVSRRALPVRAP